MVSAGSIGDGGVVSSNIGSATNAAGNIVFNGGTLKYTGASATSDRAFTINADKTATIDTANAISFAGHTGTATNGALTKIGSGALTLTGTNTYSGATTVSAGTLYVTGALSSSVVTVEANGAIGSNGSDGTLGNGLTISAGGKLDLTDALLGSDSTGILSITGGSLTLDNLAFTDLVGWEWLDADEGVYELIGGSFTINFGATAFLDASSAYDFGNGKKGYFTMGSLKVVIIPEASSALLGAIGALALFRRRR